MQVFAYAKSVLCECLCVLSWCYVSVCVCEVGVMQVFVSAKLVLCKSLCVLSCCYVSVCCAKLV